MLREISFGLKPIQNPICVCIYAYYEKDEKYKENLRFFLNNGILDNIDYCQL
jgi:hypothetical protein